MFTAVEALRYKCLRDISVQIGPFQVLVGPNGSGKSTFLDVLGFLHDALNNGIESAVFDRRAVLFEDLVWKNGTNPIELAVEAKIPKYLPGRHPKYPACRYEVQIGLENSSSDVSILSEVLWLMEAPNVKNRQRCLFPESFSFRETFMSKPGKRRKGRKRIVAKVPGGNDNFQREVKHPDKTWSYSFQLGPKRLALANVPDDEIAFPAATWLRRLLRERVQKLVLDSEAMRKPSPPNRSVTLFKPDGSNLPWVIHELAESDKKRFAAWIDHLRVALPDLIDITTIERPEDKHRYIRAKYANGMEIPSWGLSDGTLRMLALTLLAYLPSTTKTYLIEEPENGIHPTGVQCVFDSLSSVYESQVFLATHSPVILNMAKPEDVLCFARTDEGVTDIIRGADHPALSDWQRDTALGELFAAGVLG